MIERDQAHRGRRWCRAGRDGATFVLLLGIVLVLGACNGGGGGGGAPPDNEDAGTNCNWNQVTWNNFNWC